MNLTSLQRLGFTEGEIKVYSALLDTGETTRTELAKKSGISPSKVYDVANRLIEKGIVSSVKKNGIMHFSAASPERLKDFIQHKEESVQEERKLVDEIMPLLISKYTMHEERTDIEVFYGWDGMRTVYNDIVKTLSKGDINYVFGASLGQDIRQADIFYSQYIRRAKKKGYKIRIIFNENVRSHAKRASFYASSPYEARYLYQDTFTEINFYKNTVLFIMLLKKPVIIRVKNKEASDSFRKFFDTMWSQAKR